MKIKKKLSIAWLVVVVIGIFGSLIYFVIQGDETAKTILAIFCMFLFVILTFFSLETVIEN